jgi:hypothetical protein
MNVNLISFSLKLQTYKKSNQCQQIRIACRTGYSASIVLTLPRTRRSLSILLRHLEVSAASPEPKVPLPGLGVAVLKAVRPALTLPGLYQVREKGEVVTLGRQGITVNAVMAVFIQIRKDLPVAPQLRMHVPDVIVLITVKTVVVIIAALIGTEFLIRPPKEPGSAVKTYSFHSECFDKDMKYLIFINLIST